MTNIRVNNVLNRMHARMLNIVITIAE